MRVRVFFAIAFFPLLQCAQGTEGVFDPGKPCVGFKTDKEKLPVPDHHLRQADVAWEKSVWRDIDLREKRNLPLYYPVEIHPCRKSMFQVLCKEILSGKLKAFSDEYFMVPYSLSEIRKKLVTEDSLIQYVVDAEGNTNEQMVGVSDSTSIYRRVLKYRVKENWVFDKQRSSVEVRMTALAAYEWIEDKEAWRELFWLYFPACREALAREGVFNYANDAEERSFDEIFMKRMFSSVVVKESNVFDRYINEYERGIDALTESDKIKMNIFTWEHDLWQY